MYKVSMWLHLKCTHISMCLCIFIEIFIYKYQSAHSNSFLTPYKHNSNKSPVSIVESWGILCGLSACGFFFKYPFWLSPLSVLQQFHQRKPVFGGRQPRATSSLEGYNLPPDGASFMKRINGVFNCSECTFSTNNIHRIKEHTTKHTGVNYFKCLGCGETFPTVHRMQAHIRDRHKLY